MASASLPFWLIRASFARSQFWNVSASGRLLRCRMRHRSSALRPRMFFSMA